MRFVLCAIILIASLLVSSAQAQIGSPNMARPGGLGPVCPGSGALCGPVPTAATFVGPCDLGVQCVEGWGAERLTGAYTGPLVNACLASSTTTCRDIAFDTSGGLSATDMAALGCVLDTDCLIKKKYSQFGGCDLTNASSSNWFVLQAATTENGHASILQSNGGINGQLLSSSCASRSSLVLAGIVSGGTTGSFDTLFVVGTPGSGQNTFEVVNIPGLSAVVRDSGGSAHVSSGITIPTGTYCVVYQGSNTNAQIVVNGTADTAASFSASFTAQTLFNMGFTGAPWRGETNAVAILTPGTSNANAGIVANKMAQFWQASPTC